MSIRSLSNRDLSPEGLIVLIEGDDLQNNTWYNAFDWQREAFSKALKWGTMKSMGAPNEYEISDPFKHDSYDYCFVIFNDWNPCFMINLTTKKIRQVKYFELSKNIFMPDSSSNLELITRELKISMDTITAFNKKRE